MFVHLFIVVLLWLLLRFDLLGVVLIYFGLMVWNAIGFALFILFGCLGVFAGYAYWMFICVLLVCDFSAFCLCVILFVFCIDLNVGGCSCCCVCGLILIDVIWRACDCLYDLLLRLFVCGDCVCFGFGFGCLL